MFERRSDLVNLVAVVEARGIGAAAERLALTQPAPSRAIARLAARFGAGLFERLPTGVRPTAVVADAVGRFREDFPEVEVRLRPAGRTEGLRLLEAGESDLHCGGMDAAAPMPALLRREALPAVTLGMAARRDHPLRAEAATVEALANYPWVDCDAGPAAPGRAEGLDGFLGRLHARTGRRVRTVVRAGAAGVALLASGPWLARLPLELPVRLPGRLLAALPLRFGRQRRRTGLALRRSAEDLAPVRALRDRGRGRHDPPALGGAGGQRRAADHGLPDRGVDRRRHRLDRRRGRPARPGPGGAGSRRPGPWPTAAGASSCRDPCPASDRQSGRARRGTQAPSLRRHGGAGGTVPRHAGSVDGTRRRIRRDRHSVGAADRRAERPPSEQIGCCARRPHPLRRNVSTACPNHYGQARTGSVGRCFQSGCAMKTKQDHCSKIQGSIREP